MSNGKPIKRLFALALLCIGLHIQDAYAQLDPLFSQYMYNMNIINPAYAGSVDAAEFGLNTRAQWIGVNGSPTTVTFAASTPLGFFENTGVGISSVTDMIGPSTVQDVYADFSYKIQVHSTGMLSLGLKAGTTFSFYDRSQLPAGDPAFNNLQNNNQFNLGAGLYYQDRRIFVSLSMPQIFNQELITVDGSGTSQLTNQDIYLSAGYSYVIERYLQLKPSFLVRYSLEEPMSVDINLNALWYETFETGISYRYNSALSAMFNVKVKDNLRVGYAFDYGIGDLMGTNLTSSEIFVLFDLQSKRQRFTSPRFF